MVNLNQDGKPTVCDCCEWFGEPSGPNVKFCSLCKKYLCDGCRWSKKRAEYFLKYWAKKLVYDGELPRHLRKFANNPNQTEGGIFTR